MHSCITGTSALLTFPNKLSEGSGFPQFYFLLLSSGLWQNSFPSLHCLSLVHRKYNGYILHKNKGQYEQSSLRTGCSPVRETVHCLCRCSSFAATEMSKPCPMVKIAVWLHLTNSESTYMCTGASASRCECNDSTSYSDCGPRQTAYRACECLHADGYSKRGLLDSLGVGALPALSNLVTTRGSAA